ncbi:hypothetical protein RJ640_000232 [Escallonia rubra]|uniref:Uncharacterized protein n=1 Tax=Escallonia rubra TaxID=112253 RepID=A0AA88SHC5_9ASTE|nr:hypothetical protein RJ640_000232 [Escallonia rubra]
MVRSALGSHFLLLRPHRSVQLRHQRLRHRVHRMRLAQTVPPVTVVMFNMSSDGGRYFYGVSATRDYNLAILVVPHGDDVADCMATACVDAPDDPSETGGALHGCYVKIDWCTLANWECCSKGVTGFPKVRSMVHLPPDFNPQRAID